MHLTHTASAYAHFMSYHVHQGIAREQAYHMYMYMWVMYAYRTYGVTYDT